MYLYRRAVKAYHVNIDAYDTLCLQGCKHPAKDSVLAPTIHADIDCMPVTIVFRQCSPFAAVFRNIQDRVDQLEIGYADVPSLHRKIFCYLVVLLLCDLHNPIIPAIPPLSIV